MSDIEVQDRRHSALAPIPEPSVNPLLIFQQLTQNGATIEQLNAFLTLQERWDASQLRKEKENDERLFNAAMVQFHLNPPKIWKDKHVEFSTNAGETSYFHATLGNANELISLGLAAVGISKEWIPSQTDGKISVTCRLKLGMYSKDTTLTAGADKSGGKNDIQAIVSTNSYLERHSLLAATGMATFDQDDDGRSSELAEGVTERVKLISEAKTSADVMGLYKEAYTLADTAKDKVAMNLYIEAKDKRLEELDTEEATAKCGAAPTVMDLTMVAREGLKRSQAFKMVVTKEADRRKYVWNKKTQSFEVGK